MFVLICTSDFQHFPSHSTHKLITKILWHTKYIYFFAELTKTGIILIASHWTATVVLAVVIFLSDSLREKRSVLCVVKPLRHTG